MAQTLKAGVIGAGVFGGHHSRQYAALDGVELVGVYDTHQDRAQALAEGLGARAFADAGALIAEVDLLTVASPAATHVDLAVKALDAGAHVYVEKPLAVSLADAERLVALAEARGRVLACGHQERVVSEAMGLLGAGERPLLLEAVRRQPGPSRITDVSCVLDLMIHDIDLALALNPSETTSVAASGRRADGPLLEEARAEIVLADGARLTFEASRVAEARERRMRIVFPSGEVEIDFITRAFRNTTPFALDPGFTETPAGANPLRASVAAFVAAARGEAGRPAVTGREAVHALKLALAVEAGAGA
ncbi:MAG: Gfo/Idh/MocA family oxidoreductase [Caulobacteraceae bacterium]|nr:Gfo/Idh/MocA family oxidoreductase [Caulobacteraceae bacterium]